MMTIDCEGGMQQAVRARVASAWNKWREISPLLSNKTFHFKVLFGLRKQNMSSTSISDGLMTWVLESNASTEAGACSVLQHLTT